MASTTKTAEIGEVKYTTVLLGIYCWEIFLTGNFEWSLITRQRTFEWAFVPLFLSRYSVLMSFLGIEIAYALQEQYDCQATWLFNSITVYLAVASASTLMMIRTIDLWKRSFAVAIPLVVVSLGQWAIFVRSITLLSASWDPTVLACTFEMAQPIVFTVGFVYTAFFHLILWLVALPALFKKYRGGGVFGFLGQKDLVCLVLAFFATLIPMICNLVKVNDLSEMIVLVPSYGIMCIAACRLVVSQNRPAKRSSDIYFHTMSHVAPTPSKFRLGRTRAPPAETIQTGTFLRPEVHVTTDVVMGGYASDDRQDSGRTSDTGSPDTDRMFEKSLKPEGAAL
ncbi:hypothetical protein PLICRDRAFT_34723 [Plicaturopsis crispa FD-325 SS-3]|nr:hypothetical protein PLICRDRAFT_34723 [Plicaturopsis crispa FD-325 SS-3]